MNPFEDPNMENELKMLLTAAEPNPGVWNRISETMAREEAPAAANSVAVEARLRWTSRRRILDWVAVAASVALLAVSGMAFVKMQRESISSPIPPSLSAEPPLKIMVETAPRKMELGTDTSITLNMRVKNTSAKPLTILKHNDFSEQLSIWSTRVVDAAGREVEMEPLNHKVVTQTPFTPNDFAVLKPGESIEIPVKAYLFFKDPKAGQFRVDVVYAFDGQADCEPEAQELKKSCWKGRLQATGITLPFVMPGQ